MSTTNTEDAMRWGRPHAAGLVVYPFTLLVDHVHDGDTIYGTLSADAGLGVSVSWQSWGVRFYGINAPELTTTQGKECRDYLMTIVQPGDTLSVASYSWDKYGHRIDGIPTTALGVDLCQAMLTYGHGTITYG